MRGARDVQATGLRSRLVEVALVFLKLLATTFSFSSGTPGGMFAPTLFIGAMLGGFMIGLVEAMATQYIPQGAQWTNGKVGGTYEYLDFTESLGIIFELNGMWGAPATVAK